LITNCQIKNEDLHKYLHKQPKEGTEGHLHPYKNYYKNKGYVKNGYRYSKTPAILRFLKKILKQLTPSLDSKQPSKPHTNLQETAAQLDFLRFI